MVKKLLFVFVLGLILVVAIPAAGKGPPDRGDIPDIGELYGDLYVILRDVNGVPMLDSNGCIQPISSVGGEVEIETNGEPLTITATAGEPFTLATYIDAAGDLVECELTEDMALWAQAVDFGRLNLGRSPEDVINHAFDEAVKNMNLASAIGIDPVGRLVLTFGDGTEKTIDAPAENLALYIKMMKDGHWITEDTATSPRGNKPPEKGPPPDDGPSEEPRPVLSASAISKLPLAYQSLGVATRTNQDLSNEQLLLAASLLAAAADKTGTITLDKVIYINSVYGINQVETNTLPGEVDGETYFDFRNFGGEEGYSRDNVFGGRSSGECATIMGELGWIWVLQADNASYVNFTAQCMEITGYDADDTDPVNSVRFIDMVEAYTTVCVPDAYGISCEDAGDEPDQRISYDFVDNVRGFVQAADDALQVLEYIHNYKVPEDIYPEP